MKLVIDMMGGDLGNKSTIPAVKKFLSEHDDVEIFAVGDSNVGESFNNVKNVKTLISKTVLAMDVDPMTAYRDNESSLMVGVNAFLKNNCDALVSAGSSGALLTASIFKIKRLENVKRPGFITTFPSMKENKYFVVCDVGANNANTPEELHQFAKMASLYYEFNFNKSNPVVGLLSNGTEDEKGSPVTKEAFKLLKNDAEINFFGNIEGRDVLFSNVDVLICDGFTGNVFLKTTEGTAKAMSYMLKEIFKQNLWTKLSYLICQKGLKKMKDKMDYKKVGGALLVGVNGVVIKAHGSSDENAFLSALELAYRLTKANIIEKMREALK